MSACLVTAGLAATLSLSLHPAMTPTRADRLASDRLQSEYIAPVEMNRIVSLTSVSLQQRPLDGAAWLRLAYLSARTRGQLDPRANAAVARSYAVEPLGSEITLWRLGFVLDHWSSASPEVRDAALNEFRAVYPRRSWDFDALARTARDPEGRMVASLISRRMRQAQKASAAL